MSVTVDSLQAYLRQVAASAYETVTIPGFTLCFHPRDALPFFNYAIPDEDWAAHLDGALPRLRAEFAARGRRARFEFIHQYASRLAPALRAAGFAEQARQPLMLVRPTGFRAAPPVAGVAIDELDQGAPVAEIQAFLSVQRRGFDPEGAEPATEEEARFFASGLGQGCLFVARLAGGASGMPVGVGMYGSPLEAGPKRTRIAEVAGLATLPPFRRRGIATALAARAVRSAFDRGADVVCLVAADDRAGRVYGRLGFRARATMLAYVDAREEEL